MAFVIETSLSGDKCLVLEPKESLWIEMKPTQDWNSLNFSFVFSLTSISGSNVAISRNAVPSQEATIIEARQLNDQMIFGFTNNNQQLPNDPNYTGNFVGMCNFSGTNAAMTTNILYFTSSAFGGVCYGQSGNFSTSQNALFSTLSQSNSFKTGILGAMAGAIARWDGKIYFTESMHINGNYTPEAINDRILHRFELSKTGNAFYYFYYRNNCPVSVAGNRYSGQSASRDNLFNFTRNSQIFTQYQSQYGLAPISGVFPCGTDNLTGERFEPKYFLINFPFTHCMLRIHGAMAEYYT